MIISPSSLKKCLLLTHFTASCYCLLFTLLRILAADSLLQDYNMEQVPFPAGTENTQKYKTAHPSRYTFPANFPRLRQWLKLTLPAAIP